MKKSKVLKQKEFEFINVEDSLKFVKNGIEVVRSSASSIKKLVCAKFIDGEEEMTFGKLLFFVNLSLARIYLRDLSKDDFYEINFSDSASKIVSKFHDKTIGICIKENGNVDGIRNLISKSVENMADIAYATNESCGSTINLIDMLELAERNPSVKKILNMKVNENGDYYDTTKKILDSNKKLLQAIKNDPLENAYANLMSSISPGQFQQVFCCVGYKPEVTSSNIFPHCVNTSLLRGFRNEMDYYVSAMGSRKALITNSVQVKKAGYVSRKLLLLVMNQRLSSVEDCGSKNLIDVTIENEDIFSRLIGRYHLSNKKLKLINEDDIKLIGRNIKMRSPMTCKCKDGICRVCNGDSWKINPFHIGISGVLTLTEQLTQVLLSSKHLLQVNPEKVILPNGLEKFFYVDKTSLVSKKQFKINIQKIENNDEDELITSKFIIIEGDESHTFEFPEGQELCLTPILDKINVYKPDNIVEIFEEAEVFNLIIENSELVTPLKNLIKLLESEATLNESGVSEILQTFLNLLSKAKLHTSSLAIELILRELMRNPLDIQERPTKFDERDDYKFLKLTNALVNSPSLGITLSFERLNYVVENNIFKKSSGSLIDGLF